MLRLIFAFHFEIALQPVGPCDQAVRHSELDLHSALYCGDDSQAHGLQSEGKHFNDCFSSGSSSHLASSCLSNAFPLCAGLLRGPLERV